MRTENAAVGFAGVRPKSQWRQFMAVGWESQTGEWAALGADARMVTGDPFFDPE